jgi:hypothetical protein
MDSFRVILAPLGQAGYSVFLSDIKTKGETKYA